jgi:hypothetical protein
MGRPSPPARPPAPTQVPCAPAGTVDGEIHTPAPARPRAGPHPPSHALAPHPAEPLPTTCRGVPKQWAAPTRPQDPTCTRASLLGRVLPLGGADEELARTALFSRHPAMQGWPAGHQFALWVHGGGAIPHGPYGAAWGGVRCHHRWAAVGRAPSWWPDDRARRTLEHVG